ncbi:fumarylacetoacetate hydrolase family protein [Paraburkholderia terrae]|uniref:FAA hydrolase family protein n=1 Tax=Paraburkholderia terrae TaxID=311230 RepID=A0A2I8ET52_9BURK|nr:fumarylacetoacetate hydrolase family protein [Paraburkholderia terrae]AUT62777.1 FAA hydrolase family protein [Paraburkholderia terrae]
MRLVSFIVDERQAVGVVADNIIIELEGAKSLKALLSNGTDALQATVEAKGREGHRYSLEEVTLLPVIPDPDKIICIGLNYRAHQVESGFEAPKYPPVFTRFANSQVGSLQPLVVPKVSEDFDYEGELAVVIGKRGRHIPVAAATDYIAGYSCYNDGSLRDYQWHTSQFGPGKNFVATGGFGPWLVTPDEAGDPDDMTLVTRLNGRVVQQSPVSDLIFSIPEIIAYCSTFTELVPGDVIVTGTPSGVGAYHQPPLWMKDGDMVEVEISGVGILRNPVIAE